jgi:hypothetical protein
LFSLQNKFAKTTVKANVPCSHCAAVGVDCFLRNSTATSCIACSGAHRHCQFRERSDRYVAQMVASLAEKIATVSGNFQSLVALVNDQPSLRALARDNELKVEFLKGFTDDLLSFFATAHPTAYKALDSTLAGVSRDVRERSDLLHLGGRRASAAGPSPLCRQAMSSHPARSSSSSFLALIAKSPSKRRHEESSVPEGRGNRVRRVDSAVSVASSLCGSQSDKFKQLDDLTSELTDEEEE